MNRHRILTEKHNYLKAMDYELAKKLKDAGFPKDLYLTCKKPFIDQMHDCRCDKPDCLLEISNPPTLSELIEACGDDFESLKRIEKDSYKVYSVKEKGEGKTPEEALANLWLKLMAKK